MNEEHWKISEYLIIKINIYRKKKLKVQNNKEKGAMSLQERRVGT